MAAAEGEEESFSEYESFEEEFEEELEEEAEQSQPQPIKEDEVPRGSVPQSAELPAGSEKAAKESSKSGEVLFSDINDIKSTFRPGAPKNALGGSEKSKLQGVGKGKKSKKSNKDDMIVEDILGSEPDKAEPEKLSDGQ